MYKHRDLVGGHQNHTSGPTATPGRPPPGKTKQKQKKNPAKAQRLQGNRTGRYAYIRQLHSTSRPSQRRCYLLPKGKQEKEPPQVNPQGQAVAEQQLNHTEVDFPERFMEDNPEPQGQYLQGT